MPDLDTQLRAVRSIAGPDLWTAIEERSRHVTSEDPTVRPFDPGRDGPALRSQLPPAGRRWVAAAVATAIALASTYLVVRDLRFRSGPEEAAAGPSVLTSIRLPTPAYSMGFADGSVWALTERGVVRVDAATNRIVARIPIFGNHYTPNEMSATPFGIFVTVERRGMVRIDPATNAVVARWSFQADFVSASADAVWVTSPDAGEVIRLDPVTDRVVARVAVPGRPTGVLATDRAIWVVNDHPGDDRETITMIDPDTNQVARVVPVHGELAEELVGTADGLVWVAGCLRTSGSSCAWSALALDGRDGRIVERRPLRPATPADIHVAWGDRLWGSAADNYIGPSAASGTVFELDPQGRVVWTIDVGSQIGDVTYGDGSVWAGEGRGIRLVRIDPGT